ncbi:MAG: hypothetical protein MUE74_11030 [Bacteroidales bacterium]|jgi:hypothetical protein|nr:hypothetical protein [Bacteroidales bacterium]
MRYSEDFGVSRHWQWLHNLLTVKKTIKLDAGQKTFKVFIEGRGIGFDKMVFKEIK